MKYFFCSATCRNIDIFRSSLSEARAAVARVTRGGEGEHRRGGGYERMRHSGGRGGSGGGSERMGSGGGHSGGAQPYYVVTQQMVYPAPQTPPRLQGNVSPGQMRHGREHAQRQGELAMITYRTGFNYFCLD